MSSGVPIDKAQAVHAGGESALWKWISWNFFFIPPEIAITIHSHQNYCLLPFDR